MNDFSATCTCNRSQCANLVDTNIFTFDLLEIKLITIFKFITKLLNMSKFKRIGRLRTKFYKSKLFPNYLIASKTK